MQIAGWIVATVVALMSILNVTASNSANNQRVFEDHAPIVEDANLPVEASGLEPFLTPSAKPAIVEVTRKSEQTLESEPAPVKVQEPAPTQSRESNCHPSYSGCLNANASDYDCAGGSGNGPYYTGPVRVLGPDVFDLDRDNDGVACE